MKARTQVILIVIAVLLVCGLVGGILYRDYRQDAIHEEEIKKLTGWLSTADLLKEMAEAESCPENKINILDLVKEDEMPLVGDWEKYWVLMIKSGEKQWGEEYKGCRVDFITRDVVGGGVIGDAYYDITTQSSVLKAVRLYYFKDEVEFITEKVWIREGNYWKFIEPETPFYQIRPALCEDGSIKFVFEE